MFFKNYKTSAKFFSYIKIAPIMASKTSAKFFISIIVPSNFYA